MLPKARVSNTKAKKLVASVKARTLHVAKSGDLHRLPKGHWMRTDAAKRLRKAKSGVGNFGKYTRGVPGHTV